MANSAALGNKNSRAFSFSFLAGLERDKAVQGLLLLFALAVLTLAVVLPLAQVVWKSLSNSNGNWMALDNYKAYFASPALWTSIKNSLFISCATTLLVIPAAFAYAYGLTRTLMRAEPVRRAPKPAARPAARPKARAARRAKAPRRRS